MLVDLSSVAHIDNASPPWSSQLAHALLALLALLPLIVGNKVTSVALCMAAASQAPSDKREAPVDGKSNFGGARRRNGVGVLHDRRGGERADASSKDSDFGETPTRPRRCAAARASSPATTVGATEFNASAHSPEETYMSTPGDERLLLVLLLPLSLPLCAPCNVKGTRRGCPHRRSPSCGAAAPPPALTRALEDGAADITKPGPVNHGLPHAAGPMAPAPLSSAQDERFTTWPAPDPTRRALAGLDNALGDAAPL
mmetsp:Transcript_30707/g.65370  ORF Transcript_30707/g.65370 Transcript_30707/m.65370 type:complete len:256 (+) Transcript_30707:671-1438(+)